MESEENKGIGTVTIRAFVIGVLLCGLFAWMTAMRDNANPAAARNTYLSGNLIPVLPHVLLLLAGILINPLLKRLKVIRLFCRAEMLLIFVMCAVSAGVASWGLSGQLIPMVPALSNKAWNTDQSQWDVQAAPFLNENYFIAAQGSQAAAKRLRAVHVNHEEARLIYRTARDLQLGKEELARVESDMQKIAAEPPSEERAARERAIVWPHAQAVKLVETSAERWEKIGGGLDLQVVVDTYSDKIKKLKEERDLLRDELKAINKNTFEAVEEIRKGLPAEKRAFPGFFYSGGEGFASYSARIKRLRVGGRSRDKLVDAESALSRAINDGAALPDGWSAGITEASGMLVEISDIPALSGLNNNLSTQLKDIEDSIADQKVEGRRLRDLRRYSKQTQFEAFNDRIDELDASTAELEAKAKALTDRIEKQVRPLLSVCDRVKTASSGLQALAEDSKTTSLEDYPALRARLQTIIASYAGFDASARRYWLGDAKWLIWLRPLCNWMLLVFIGYMILMAFNVLIFRQWAHNEKLIYPLAEVATIAAGGATPDAAGKTLFRSGLFWTGFALAAGILGWNYLATNNIVPNISPVSLENRWWSYFGDGILRGLQAQQFTMIFVVIGISFLVPSGISFSLWFFEVCYMVLLLVMVWLGYGYDRQSLNSVGRAGMGTGGILVFGVLILFTCRRYLLCAFSPGVLKGLAQDEARELRVSSVIFLGGSAVLLSIMTFGLGANPLLAILFFLVTLTVIIALIRVVAEGGLLGVENAPGALGIIKTLFGVSNVWGVPFTLAPLGIYMSLLFGGTKAFIAPIMANSLKIREQFRMRRIHFHGAIAAGIVVAAIISVVTLVMISYDRGADNLHGWLNTAGAKASIDGIKQPVLDTFQPVNPSDRLWMLTGMVLMTGLLFARRRIFGVPHPIGLMMLMNASMLGFWGSIMLGWLFKSIVSKYCSHEQYISIRRFFVGLVLGHLLAILFGWDYLDFHWG